MFKQILKTMLLPIMLLSLASCAEEGGGNGVVTQGTRHVLTIALTGTLPAGTNVAGAGFLLTLPQGVTPLVDGNNTVTGIETVDLFPAGGSFGPIYTASNNSILVTLNNSNPAGSSSLGVIGTIILNAPIGKVLTPADFIVSNDKAIDLPGNPIPGVRVYIKDVVVK